jgi:putative endonuclease
VILRLLALLRGGRGAEGPAHLRTGRWGEAVAARELQRRGLLILGRGVRVGRRGELDLVARDGAVLVFVEVKTRRSEAFGRPVDAVDSDKRRTLSRAACGYVRRLQGPTPAFRFDVVEVIGEPGAGEPKVRVVQNAFFLDRRYMPPRAAGGGR